MLYLLSIVIAPSYILQKPRVCILGGGFGGLYTSLQLQSLEWPDDKKPQVSCNSDDFFLHSYLPFFFLNLVATESGYYAL